MHRIVVVGTSGSGKTTVAREMGQRLDFPVLELDSIHHQAGWEPLPEEEFRVRVAGFALQPSWVIDGNYTSRGMAELIWPVADTLVWLDLPKHVVMAQITRRTLRRWVTREVLWNGNREPITGPFRIDPEKNVIRWAWTTYEANRARYEEALSAPETVHLRVFRLQSVSEVEAFLSSLP